MTPEFVIVVFGLIMGSFLNVCIYRIPREQSIVLPPSACPKCGHRLSPLELIPVISFLIQGCKCRECKDSISWRYPLIEILTAVIFYLVYLRFGASFETLKYLILSGLMMVIALIDFDLQIIPNVLSIPGIVIGLILSYDRIFDSLLGIAVGFLIIWLVVQLSRGGMGLGDAKLLAMIGAFAGWQVVIYTLFLGSFLGSIVGGIMILAKKATRKTAIPFGPYLCLGAVLVILFDLPKNYWLLFH